MDEKVLIVSSQENDSEKLIRLFGSFNMQTAVVPYAGKARRRLLEDDFNLVVINAPLSDEFGIELAINAAEKTSAGILLFVKSDLFFPTVEKAEKYGVFVLEKPLKAPLADTVRHLRAVFYRLSAMRRENRKLLNKISEMRTVERAKIALMQYENMSEDDAHKFIERQSMSRRTEKGAIALEILRRYGD